MLGFPEGGASLGWKRWITDQSLSGYSMFVLDLELALSAGYVCLWLAARGPRISCQQPSSSYIRRRSACHVGDIPGA